MNEDELESKSVMIYINEETVNKLKEYPSIEEKDPITGEWITATVTVDGIYNIKPEEEENNSGLEYTEEEIAYNKIDDVMFDKKCLNTEIEKVVKTVEPIIEPEPELEPEPEPEPEPIIEQEMFYLDGKIMSVGYNKDEEIESNRTTDNKIITRSHFSIMMFSHICIIMPCSWWMRIDRPDTDNSIFYSKLMSIIMTTAIMIRYLYHYYNERILCDFEYEYMKFAIVCLNIYMYLRNVSIFYIIPGGGILYILNQSVHHCNSQNKKFYELYQPICNYIAGFYIYYCVWNLERVQPTLYNTIKNDVIFNDIYSGVNYHNI